MEISHDWHILMARGVPCSSRLIFGSQLLSIIAVAKSECQNFLTMFSQAKPSFLGVCTDIYWYVLIPASASNNS